MVVKIAQCIITKIVNNQIAFYIMDLKNFQDIWHKLKSIYTKIGQEVIYLIFQKLFNYPKINKLKKYNKPVIQIFTEIKYLCKCLCTIINLSYNLWNTIAIVIILNTLHNDFDITTTNLLKSGNKTIDQIQSILQSKKVKNINKQIIGIFRDLIMAFRNNKKVSKK